jgi:hypothetical protein
LQKNKCKFEIEDVKVPEVLVGIEKLDEEELLIYKRQVVGRSWVSYVSVFRRTVNLGREVWGREG